MSELPELVPAPPELFTQQQKSLVCDLFIYIIQTDNIIHFRRKGDELSEGDLESLTRMPRDHVLVPKEQLTSPPAEEEPSTEIDLKRPPALVSPRAPDEVTTDFLRTLIRHAAATAERMPLIPPDNRRIAYGRVFIEGDLRQEPLLTHLRQVCSLSVLMHLTTHSDPQEITDLAVAAMVHDVGLFWGSEALQLKHVNDIEFTPEDAKFHAQHIDGVLKVFSERRVPLTPTSVRIIQHHHENWDGSGLKGLRQGQIYQPARILRIADQIVSMASGSASDKSLVQILHALLVQVSEAGEPKYDQAILNAVLVEVGDPS